MGLLKYSFITLALSEKLPYQALNWVDIYYFIYKRFSRTCNHKRLPISLHAAIPLNDPVTRKQNKKHKQKGGKFEQYSEEKFLLPTIVTVLFDKTR